MSGWVRYLMVLLLCCTLVPSLGAASQTPTSGQALASEGVLIIENVGQFDAGARYQLWGGPGTTWLAEDAIWITLQEPAEAGDAGRDWPTGEQPQGETPRRGVALRLSFEGANPHPQIEPFGSSETVVSYFYGSDPAQWRPDVPVWTGVRYRDLYPGLDLEISGGAGGWAWRMVAREVGAQQAAPLQNVRLRVEGAEVLSLHPSPTGRRAGDEGQALRLQTAVGDLSLPLLEVVGTDSTALALPKGGAQIIGESVSAPFAHRVADAPALDSTSSLAYSTYLGGSGRDRGYALAVDSLGRAHVAGTTDSLDFPATPGVFETDDGGVFVSVLNADGSALVWSTFLGAGRADAIAVNAAGQVYLTGYASSPDFPTTPGAYDTMLAGQDAFVTVLNAGGTGLVYSTFVGGSEGEQGLGIALAADGTAYIGGRTNSDDLPVTLGAIDSTYNDIGYRQTDAFVAALNPAGSALVYCTYLGGEGQDYCDDIAVDAAGRAYVTGMGSIGFPVTPGTLDTNAIAGAFVSVLNPQGTALVYGLLLRGAIGTGIALDSAGRVHISGGAWGDGLPTTPGAFDRTQNGGYQDGCACLFNPTLTRLVYCTYLGGSEDDGASGVAVDSAGRTYVTGASASPDYPTTPGAPLGSPAGYYDAYLTVLDPTGASLLYSTFLGGGSRAWDIAAGARGETYVTGQAGEGLLVTPGAYDTTFGGLYDDVFVTKLVLPEPTPTPTATLSPSPSATRTATRTASPSRTRTPTASPTATTTASPSATCTPTLEGTIPPPPTPAAVLPLVFRPAPTPTLTATRTRRPTRTSTLTPTRTRRPSKTPTPTLTCTATLTRRPTRTRTATQTSTPTLTATVTRTPTRTPVPQPTWARYTTVVKQDFEGDFPGAWTVTDATGSGYSFGKRTCRTAGGPYAGWVVGGGALGAELACGSNYPDNVDTSLIHGPFSLENATQAMVVFEYWYNMELGTDMLEVGASIGGDFWGYGAFGEYERWSRMYLGLNDIPTLGNLLGQPQVWIAVRFTSDASTSRPVGAYVDNITVRKCEYSTCNGYTSVEDASNALPGVRGAVVHWDAGPLPGAR